MTQVVNLKLSGLATYPNYLSEVPPGALLECSNFNLDRTSVATKRRGFFLYGTALSNSTARVKQLFPYKTRVFRHYDTTIEYDDGSGNFSPFVGSFSEVSSDTRIKTQEVNGNLYFTSSQGIRKISASSASQLNANSVTYAGGVKALDLEATANYTQPGFLPPLSQVSYRLVWGIKDNNNVTILGTPSPLSSVQNTSTTETCVVDLSFPIPDGITSDYFYQVYRSAIVTALNPAGMVDLVNQDECFLVIEDFPTSITGRSIITDITPEDFRVGGTPLYTNAISGEGITQANDAPPLAKDITLYRNYTFYANTKTKHRLNLSLVSTEGFISGTSKLILSNGATTEVYTFRGQAAQSSLEFSGSNFSKANLDGEYFFLRTASSERLYGFWFDGTGSTVQPSGADTVGVLMQRVDISSGGANNAAYLAKLQTVINDTLDFTTTLVGTLLTIDNVAAGNTDPWHISNASLMPIVDTGGAVATFTNEIVQGLGEDLTNKTILLSTKPTVGQRIEETVLSIVQLINATSSGLCYASYSSSPTDVPGQFYIESRTNADVPFYVAMNATTSSISSIVVGTTTTINTSSNHNLVLGSEVEHYNITGGGGLNAKFVVSSILSPTSYTINFDSTLLTPTGGTVINGVPSKQFTPTLARAVDVVSQSVSNPTTITTSFPHQLNANYPALIYSSTGGTPSINNGYTPSSITPTTFTIPVNTIVAGTGAYVFAGTTPSSNEASPNRLYFSKLQQPEAVPLLNYIDVGPKDKAISRIIALRDSLYILKQDGIYRLSGDTTTNFSVSLFDSSSSIISADSAAVLNNQIYLFSTQGVIRIGDSGVEIISRPIEDKVITMFQNASAANSSFAITSESDRAYMLFTTKNKTDTTNTICYRYNNITEAWTSWDISKTAGMLNIGGDKKIYLGASDVARVEKERKNLDRTDYADREFAAQLGLNAVSGNVVKLNSLSGVAVGDVVYQLQYVTIDHYNRILRKLDIDGLLPNHDFVSTLLAGLGDNISNKIAALAAKMNIEDPSTFTDTVGNTSYVYTSPISLQDQQTEYNNMIIRMNESPNLSFTNYFESVGTTEYEGLITAIDTFTNKVTLFAIRPFVEGNVTIYKAISGSIKWVPNPCGDPSTMKQITSATVMFEDLSFTTAAIKYSTDLIKSYTGTTFLAEGTGIFGQKNIGDENFGGVASSEALRTLVPRDKARCRYISCEFDHYNAREEVKLYGMSLTSYEISERAYQGRK